MSSTILPQVRPARKSSRVPFSQPPGHPIAYFPSLSPYVGGSNAAILCCQLVYWTPRAKDPDGWIYKEQLDIMAETGLSRDEQRTARRALKARKLLLERYDRLNHRLYLKIDVEAYNALIQRMYDEGVDPEGLYLVTTVDIADTDEVMAVVGDRLVELQVDAGLPVYVTPLRPIERVIAQLREREAAIPPAPLPFP